MTQSTSCVVFCLHGPLGIHALTFSSLSGVFAGLPGSSSSVTMLDRDPMRCTRHACVSFLRGKEVSPPRMYRDSAAEQSTHIAQAAAACTRTHTACSSRTRLANGADPGLSSTEDSSRQNSSQSPVEVAP